MSKESNIFPGVSAFACPSNSVIKTQLFALSFDSQRHTEEGIQ